MDARLTDRLLGLVSILLALPAFFGLFLGPYRTAATLTIVFSLLLLTYAATRIYISALPAYTFLEDRFDVRFSNDSPDLAKVTRILKVRPNYPHLDEMRLTRFGADGEACNFRWNSQTIEPTRLSSRYQIVVRFAGPHPRFQTFEGTLSYELRNSFKSESEYFFHSVSYRCHLYHIDIEFPENKRCHGAEAYVEIGAHRTKLPTPILLDGGKRLVFNASRPRPGAEYQIFWSW